MFRDLTDVHFVSPSPHFWLSNWLCRSKMIIFCFLDCRLTSRTRTFRSYGDVNIIGERLQNLAYMLGTYGIWKGKGLNHDTLAVSRALGFCGFIWRTAPNKSTLMTCKGYQSHVTILTLIPTGMFLNSYFFVQMCNDYSKDIFQWYERIFFTIILHIIICMWKQTL